MMSEIVWDLLESNASERYFVDGAEEPAFLIGRGPWAINGCWTLYMNHVAALGSFTSLGKARERLLEMIRGAKKTVKVFRETRRSRRLFAESIKKNKDDNIYVIDPPKKQIKPIMADLAFRGLENPTVIPKKGGLVRGEGTGFIRKVRGKPLVEVTFFVDTVKMRYRDHVWQDGTQFTLHIPLRQAEDLGAKLVECAQRAKKK